MQDEIVIKYKIRKNNKIKLFGKNFVSNNKHNCKIKINNEEKELIDCFDEEVIDNMPIKKDFIEIELTGINNLYDLSNMFYGCETLIEIQDLKKLNNLNITNIDFMFYGCESLISLPDISDWDTSNITNMNSIFYGCKSLVKLPDISKWNTSKVEYMSYLFFKCQSLLSFYTSYLLFIFK